jgi:hypothetical protein
LQYGAALKYLDLQRLSQNLYATKCAFYSKHIQELKCYGDVD